VETRYRPDLPPGPPDAGPRDGRFVWAPRPGVRRRPPRSRPGLHLALLAATALSAAYAGGAFWLGMLTRLSDLFDPGVITRTIAAGLPYAFWVLLILGAHEMGHYLACRRYGIPATLPFFIPGPPPLGSFGAVIRIRGAIPDRKALFDVAAAGPLAGFAIALPLLLWGLFTAEPLPGPPGGEGTYLGPPVLVWLIRWFVHDPGAIQVSSAFGAGWVGMLVTSLNLFPVGQLDGGHAAYAVSRRLHALLARLTLGVMFLLLLYHVLVIRQAPAYLVWFALLLWMRDRHPRLQDETSPLGPGRKIVALLLLLIFLLSFIPIPLLLIGG
jgi:membrane-associated protease RseP (regulator of RpoE activity)